MAARTVCHVGQTDVPVCTSIISYHIIQFHISALDHALASWLECLIISLQQLLLESSFVQPLHFLRTSFRRLRCVRPKSCRLMRPVLFSAPLCLVSATLGLCRRRLARMFASCTAWLILTAVRKSKAALAAETSTLSACTESITIRAINHC